MIGAIVLAELNPVSEIAPHRLFSISVAGKEIVFSNHMFMIAAASILLGIVVPVALGGGQLVRRGAGNFIEGVCVFLREELAMPFLGDKTDKYIDFIWTVFFFIITLNLMGLVPFEKFFTLISVLAGGKKVHIGGAATANIWVTGALAMVSFVVIHLSGIKEHGFRGYFKNFIPPTPLFIRPFIYLIEFMSTLIKPFALAIRLFANILAGHILLSVILGFIIMFKSIAVAGSSIVFAVAMGFMEIFVACLQAYIFTFLTTIFISFAIAQEH